MQEEWRDIVGYKDMYQVSNLGNVRSLDRFCVQSNSKKNYNHIYRGKVLKQFKNNAGYMQVQLSYRYKSIPKRVHRLVAEAFIPNPNNYKCINHKDGNKLNNCVDNLEWCTYSQNNRHAREIGLNKGISYKTRCLKAIEYIKNNKLCICKEDEGMIFTAFVDKELLKILKGSDNSE